ncbi:hypothetical protein SAMN05444374_11643 [Rhodococcoides kroppenstedtii]|uniref:Uncharacterized protein n=2 Tax=Rhodococcoides kroppenstedtii TaxID=293050 RepID=A0A1I0UA01_9NOCA|nr:hypothetical protein [Rhodococcus kroppenstedtii]SFA60861.1 hypothetical protein SAMN05444374_11643 [Rhodococcus kroppenstedtii]
MESDISVTVTETTSVLCVGRTTIKLGDLRALVERCTGMDEWTDVTVSGNPDDDEGHSITWIEVRRVADRTAASNVADTPTS